VKELESRLENQEGGQMSFLEHLDELRKRLVRSAIIVVVAFIFCFFASEHIYRFLSVPIVRALNEASQKRAAKAGGEAVKNETIPLTGLKTGDKGKYVFEKATMIGTAIIQPGATVAVGVTQDEAGKPWLILEESVITNTGVVSPGTRIPVDLTMPAASIENIDERLIVTTPQEAFTLYVTVSLYAAIALSIPLLLFQVWGFISPALYSHEKAYVTPFILLSSIAFVAGAAFAYYILFPPAVEYLLGVADDFQPLLRATDYFDLITLIMLAMGIIFQMPAVTYVLARIGIVTAGFLVRVWKIALIVILVVAAFVSPTGDIPNLMLFALPMVALYIISIFIAWLFGKKREAEPAV
jgi:sec-independent protein translocase protein TatC